MKRNILISIGIVVVILAGALWFLSRNPEFSIINKVTEIEDIELTLPYNPENPTEAMLPMGETIDHTENPHAGIDFQWRKSVPIVASLDGKINSIETHEKIIEGKSLNFWDVEVDKGVFQVRYNELQNLAPGIEKGKKIERGDLIGHSLQFTENHSQIHWEFAYKNRALGRICPMKYFNEESRGRIEKEWIEGDNSMFIEGGFPYVCSGIYEEKE